MCVCSLSAIAGKLSPGSDRSGIQVLEADTFKLQAFRAPTGEPREKHAPGCVEWLDCQ